MPTKMPVDPDLLDAAQRAGRHRARRETDHAALVEYVKRRMRQKALEVFGTFEFHDTYGYKRARRDQ